MSQALLQCVSDDACPYMYQCIESVCQHDSLFTWEAGFIYLFIPFFLALANIGGVSGGYLKVPLFMDLLNYTETVATYYTYPLIFGAGIANFCLLLPQRHPKYDRPLIDYHLVNVLLPSVIFGTTLGVISNLVIPQLVLDFMVMLVFSIIAYLFIQKYKEHRINTKIQNGELSKPLTEKRKATGRSPTKSRKSLSGLQLTKIHQQPKQTESQLGKTQQTEEPAVNVEQLAQADKGYKLKEVGKSMLIFVCFQTMALLIEGKIIPFNLCDAVFSLLLLAFTLVLFAYLVGTYLYQKSKYQYYEKIHYKVEVDLSVKSNFTKLAAGGVLAGIVTGMIAAGCGHIMILVMLSMNVNPKVASATSGYQVMFIGASSTIQAVVQGSLGWVPLVFFLSLSLLGSFGLSVVAYRIISKLPDRGESKIIVILIILCLISIVGVIPNIIITQHYYGWQYLLAVKGLCS